MIAQIQKGSAAEKAGLQEGDIVILFDGKGIDNAADLSRAVASARPDTEHNVKVLREGKEAEVKVKLDAAADTSVAKGKAAEEARGRLGVTVRGLNDEEKKNTVTVSLSSNLMVLLPRPESKKVMSSYP